MPRESMTAKQTRAGRVLEALREAYPDADCELTFRTRFQFLVAVVLSAQTTDKKVNQVTRPLFRRWATAAKLAGAPLAAVEDTIRMLGLFRNKAKHIIALAQGLLDRDPRGRVPLRRAELEALPGVGRKTANVILANVRGGEPALAVDTHVTRLAGRLGFSKSQDARTVEDDICALFPSEEWGFLSHALIWHGRRVCNARKPRCEACPLAPDCPSAVPK